jgi:hypothetical protein
MRSLLTLGTLLLAATLLPLAAQPAKDDAKSADAAQQILITVERRAGRSSIRPRFWTPAPGCASASNRVSRVTCM